MPAETNAPIKGAETRESRRIRFIQVLDMFCRRSAAALPSASKGVDPAARFSITSSRDANR